jgi:hypothetical protein
MTTGHRVLGRTVIGHLAYHQAHRMTFARVTVVTQLLTSGEKVSRWRVIGKSIEGVTRLLLENLLLIILRSPTLTPR